MNNPLTQNYINYKKTWKSLFFRADLHLIWWCNFKCVMCDNWKREITLNFTHNDLLQTILTLKKYYNCNYIRFHGQEPTMYQKLEELIVFAKKLEMKTSIKTNAWLLNDKRLAKIISYLDELYLSIDWYDAETHDEIRWIKWSFLKNISVIKKSKIIKPELKIYINSVVMNKNFESLDKMLDFWKKYNLDRVSFVFLNDKNRKDIDFLNLEKKDFFYFFEKKVLEIYKKSKNFNILVDFSPFLSNLVWKDNDYIINELENNFSSYRDEIENIFEWNYWKTFYDKYWCFWPLDHASINYNWDMFGCCVVERESSNSVWNIMWKAWKSRPLLSKSENSFTVPEYSSLEFLSFSSKILPFWDFSNLWDELKSLREKEKYKDYRANSNTSCSYASKCASNFYSRKSLFKDIYLDDELYPKNVPENYYRYLKEFQNEDENIKNEIKFKKLKNILLFFFDNLEFYKKLLLEKWIKRQDLENIKNINIIEKLPILNKRILKENFEEIEKLSKWKIFINWKTSWESWIWLEFFYPLDFKRYIKQIAIFSSETDFTYNDSFFSVTPLSCNQTIINDLREPDYVKKIYINITDFSFKKEQFLEIEKIFSDNKNVKYIHTDSKYLFYIYLWFERYSLQLPEFKAIFSTYTYLNKSLKIFLEEKFNTKIYDNYGCSEVWPISADLNQKELFWDNLIIESIEEKIILTDLDNDFFPFIRYENWDIWELKNWKIEILWKINQTFFWKKLREIDDFFYKNFPKIIIYQFEDYKFLYYSQEKIDESILQIELKKNFGVEFEINIIQNWKYLKVWSCSKFKSINIS